MNTEIAKLAAIEDTFTKIIKILCRKEYSPKCCGSIILPRIIEVTNTIAEVKTLTLESFNNSCKKLILFAAIGIGLLYGSGSDLGSIKRQITSASNDNARSITQGDDKGWGNKSGY